MKRKIFIILFLTLIGFSMFVGYIIFFNSTKIMQDGIRTRANSYKNGFLYLISQEKASISNTVEDYAFWTDMGEKGVEEQDREWL